MVELSFKKYDLAIKRADAEGRAIVGSWGNGVMKEKSAGKGTPEGWYMIRREKRLKITGIIKEKPPEDEFQQIQTIFLCLLVNKLRKKSIGTS